MDIPHQPATIDVGDLADAVGPDRDAIRTGSSPARGSQARTHGPWAAQGLTRPDSVKEGNHDVQKLARMYPMWSTLLHL